MEKNIQNRTLERIPFPFVLKNKEGNFFLKIVLKKDKVLFMTVVNVVKYETNGKTCGRLAYEFFENDPMTVSSWLRHEDLVETTETDYERLLGDFREKSGKVKV